jgi:hypothetical protein
VAILKFKIPQERSPQIIIRNGFIAFNKKLLFQHSELKDTMYCSFEGITEYHIAHSFQMKKQNEHIKRKLAVKKAEKRFKSYIIQNKLNNVNKEEERARPTTIVAYCWENFKRNSHRY